MWGGRTEVRVAESSDLAITFTASACASAMVRSSL